MNRITTAIAKMEAQIEVRINTRQTTKQAVAELSKTLDMSFAEFAAFQTAKSLAVAEGRLSVEEGMTIYNLLGEAGPERFNAANVATKAVLTKIFSELLARQLA